MNKLIFPFLFIFSMHSFGQYVNNFYTTMNYLNLDSISQLPDSLLKFENKSIIRANLMWRGQLAPHGDPSVASRGMINHAINFSPPSNSYSITPAGDIVSEIGPIGTPSNSGGDGNGQMHRITFDPNYNGTTNRKMYAGSFYGGLWKSIDGGDNWFVHGTDNQLPITSVSGIAISHQNTNKLFVCTGDGDERDFVIKRNTSLFGRNPNFTLGVFRSLDDGLTWNEINLGLISDGSSQPINFADGGVCRLLRINPNNENKLFVATSRGLFRTSNAVDVTYPTIWEKLYIPITNPLMDDFRGLEFHPTNPNTMYTSSTDIFKSSNGGDTWVSMTGQNTGLDLTSLPNFQVRRINIAVTPSDPSRLYAYINGVKTITNGADITNHQSIYVFMYKNGVWQELDHRYQVSFSDAFPESFMAIAVSPGDPDKVYYGFTKVRGSIDINTPNSFIRQSNYVDGGKFHADVHELVFEPNTPNPKLYCGHHGGISTKDISFNNLNGWVYKNEGLNTNLVWSFDLSKVNSNIIAIGRQDNGISRLHPNVIGSWVFGGIGDGYGCQITDDAKGNTLNPRIATVINGNYNFGEVWDAVLSAKNPPNFIGNPDKVEVVPAQFQIVDHPVTHKGIYGFSDLYSSNEPDFKMPPSSSNIANPYKIESDLYADYTLTGDTVNRFERQVVEFDISKSNPDYIYAVTLATDSRHTRLYKSSDGLRDGVYTDASGTTPPPTYFKNITANLPQIFHDNSFYPPFIKGIAISPTDHNKVWVCFSGYDDAKKVFKTIDGGLTWTNADPTGSLPKLPTNNIVVLEGFNDKLYIATNAGVYTTDGSTNIWTKVIGIPNVQVFELRINTCSNKLYAATYGRGIWSIDLPEPNRSSYEKVISTNTTWLTNDYLETDLRIKDNSKLIIKGTIHMPYKGRIIIEPGSTLEVDGGGITNDCGYFWEGIEVWGNSNLPQTGNNQGKLILKNNAVLENAHTAVSLWKTDDWNSMGGTIEADNATFKNCRRAVAFMSYANNNVSFFKRCKFILNDDFNPNNFGEINQVTLWDVKGVVFEGCYFEDNRTALSTFSLSTGKAIFSIDAGYQLKGYCNIPNQGTACPTSSLRRSRVKNFNIGVHALGASTANTITVDQTDFEGNMQATVIQTQDNFRFIRNNISIGATPKIGYNFPDQLGLYNFQSTGFEIEANSINGNTNIPNVNSVGVLMENTGTEANQVYRNDFLNNSIAQLYLGRNRNNNQYEGMQYLCNSFTNTIDVRVEKVPNRPESKYHGIRTFQGAYQPSQSSGNQFIGSLMNQWQLQNFSDQGIVYYYKTASEQMQPSKIDPPGLIMQAYTANANTCSQLYFSSYDGNVVSNLNSEFYTLRSQYNGLLYTYFQNIDGGNTDSLLQAINMSFNSDAQNLRDELMSQAPYLSEEALREAAQTGILTDALLLEVCLANLDATRNEDFLYFLEHEIPNTLPALMIQLIYQNWSGVTPRTILESQLASTNAKLGSISNQLLYYYMSDSLDHTDSIESILEARMHTASDYRVVELAIDQEDFQKAALLISALEEGPELSETMQLEHDNLKDYIDFRSVINDNNTAILDLGQEELGTLRTIAEKRTGRSSQMAQNILCFGYGECTTFDAPQERQRSRRVYDMTKAAVTDLEGGYSMIPNPASTSVSLIIDNDLIESTSTLLLFNISGQLVIEKRIANTNTEIEVNHLENGTYLYEVFEGETIVHQGKLIIQK